MKTLKTILSIGLAAAVFVSILPTSAYATKPVPIQFEFYFDFVDNAAGVASGDFSVTSSGLGIADEGAGSQVFRLTPPNKRGEQTVHGVKTLAGADGQIIAKFNVQLEAPAPPVIVPLPNGELGLRLLHGTGKFTILSGTGAYAGLRGQGDTVIDLVLPIKPDGTPTDGPPVLMGTYEGQAHMQP
jgi:hypothetical protein